MVSATSIEANTFTTAPVRVTVINPNYMRQLHPVTQSFYRAHECGHHVRRHESMRPSYLMEQDADCYAIRVLASMPSFTAAAFQVLAADLMAHGNMGDATHLPTATRIANFRACLP